MLERGEEGRVEDVAVARHQRDEHAVGPAKLALVLRENLYVRVLGGQRFVETGIDAHARGKPSHHSGQEQKNEHQRQAAAENPVGKTFEQGRHGGAEKVRARAGG